MNEKIKLKEIIKKYNIYPKKSLGQNFIFDFNVLDKIANYASPFLNYTVIEIGPGPGGLTKSILKKTPKNIIVIEKDSKFKKNLEFIFNTYPSIECDLIIDDFLNINLNNLIKGKTKLLSNLPYYISSQILIKILPLNINIHEVLFTFQKELADRIISKHSKKNYSRLSVIAQSVCNISRKQNLPPTVFYPKPNIESSVLKFSPKKNISLKNFDTLKKISKIAFNQRRKKIVNSLSSIDNIAFFLRECGIDENLRAEDISVEMFCNLANLIYYNTKTEPS